MGFLAPVACDEPAEVLTSLQRAEFYNLNNTLSSGIPTAVFVLHGPEVAIFSRDNYGRYRDIVDLAARLTSFNVVQVDVCLTRMQ